MGGGGIDVEQIISDINKTSQITQKNLNKLNNKFKASIVSTQKLENDMILIQQQIVSLRNDLEQNISFVNNLLENLTTLNNNVNIAIQNTSRENQSHISDLKNIISNYQSNFLIICMAILFLFFIIVAFGFYYIRKVLYLIHKFEIDKEPILAEKQEDFVNVEQLSEVVLASWNLKKHILNQDLGAKLRPIQSNLNKLDHLFKELGFETIDYGYGTKYNEGMNVDVLDTIKSNVDFPIIKETIQPTIIFKDEIIKKAKIIKEIKE